MSSKKKQKITVVNDNEKEKVLFASEKAKEQEYELLDRELNMELKKVHLQERILSLQEKQQQIEQLDNRRLQIEERKTTIGIAEVIVDAMRAHIIDDERTVMGSEPFYAPVFDEIERGIMKKKFIQLMNQF
jgi:hypothetical protein